ncbi:hypothetical protein BVG79_01140 [Ketogulonicigenium robustum]|uniref:Entericidin EcnAB n=1 Tax=Ketogulonicigenium robustum TaxID=92947 RepID=A0A1W6NZ04_9RHOB|nr:entericidin A/B family lipoprotein [Ketogulonicigenium robustum]ARO14486.1 hypothetical protein BVG79_01140 [Ketogulonicigenium robustum]
MKNLIILVALAGLAACSTIEGAGRDLQSAGQSVSQEARRAQAAN